MPYKKIEDLQANIKDHLPKHAQEIYLKTFNNAYERYDDEQIVIKIAWSAVKKSYCKNSEGKWTKIQD